MPRGIPNAPLTKTVPPTIRRDAVNETAPLDAQNKSFIAKWPGNCARCGEAFEVGDDVHYEANEIVADHGCDELSITDDDSDDTPHRASKDIPVMPRGKTAHDACRTCFQVPSSNGTCGCF